MMRLHIGHKLAALSPRWKLLIMISIDAFFLPVCMLSSVVLRVGTISGALAYPLALQVAIGLLTLPVLGMAGLYRSVMRYIDLRVVTAASIAMAVVALSLVSLALLFKIHVLPRSALLIYWFVAFAYVIASRFLARTLLQQSIKRGAAPRVHTAIYGAGDAGVQLAQSMLFSPEYKAVCFFDDRSLLHRKTVAGLRVYSPRNIDEAVERHGVAQIVVAIPSASKAHKRELIARLTQSGLPVKMLPGLVDLVSGTVAVSDIREVDVSDLLGRDPVPPLPSLFARNIEGKVVLVTGAGGSIGSELCRQIVSQHPRRLVLLDHSEYALYAIDQELRQLSPPSTITPCLGSVLDETLLTRLFQEHGVQTIYHAAAYKHVPLVEGNIEQGLRNNVLGAQALTNAALAAQIETCVLISTDKAVRPTNVMGASKRAAELLFQAAAMRSHSRTVFSMVRFGNVLGSSGSVVPLFKKQIQAGGPITITHPEVIRYFMLIPEAAQLVIQAGALAKGGEVFVLDMGEPVRIADLARSMISLSGLTEKTPDNPGGDIEVKCVGLRPGEKLYEELLIGGEVIHSGHPRIMCARERHIEPALLDKMVESLRQACDQNDHEAMLRQLHHLVPEYTPSQEVQQTASASTAQA